MGHVTVDVNGRKYKMSCDEGSEQRVADLAAFVDSLVQDIKSGYRQVQEERLYLMAALIVTDQLLEVRDELQATLAQICNLRSFQAADSATTYVPTHDVARIVDASSKRLQALEQKLARTGTG
jgi:cell division protein ZapA